MFGFGKRRIHFEQHCQDFVTTLLKLAETYRDFLTAESYRLGILNDEQYVDIFNELYIFQHSFAGILFCKRGIKDRLNMEPFDMGFIHSSVTRKTLEVNGYEADLIDYIAEGATSYSEMLVEILAKSPNFTNSKEQNMCFATAFVNHLESIIDIPLEARGTVILITYQVCKSIEQTFEDSLSNAKLIL